MQERGSCELMVRHEDILWSFFTSVQVCTPVFTIDTCDTAKLMSWDSTTQANGSLLPCVHGAMQGARRTKTSACGLLWTKSEVLGAINNKCPGEWVPNCWGSITRIFQECSDSDDVYWWSVFQNIHPLKWVLTQCGQVPPGRPMETVYFHFRWLKATTDWQGFCQLSLLQRVSAFLVWKVSCSPGWPWP